MKKIELLRGIDFKCSIEGKEVKLYTLTNRGGATAQFTNYGARWLSMWVPDRNGKQDDVVLGFNTLNDYLKATEKYHGATIGRVCGRIDNGKFTLNGKSFQLSNNDSFGKPLKNHLHGGEEGLSFQVWRGEKMINSDGEESLMFSIFDKERKNGYPGNLKIRLIYTLTNNNVLKISFQASTYKPTIVNLTNHPYFNLSGNKDDVLDHQIKILAKNVLECDHEFIPTGNIIPVKDTPLDFTSFNTIGKRIDENFPGQLFPGKGYNVSYVLDENVSNRCRLAASVWEEESGRLMNIYTNQSCLQFYSGWLFDGSDVGKFGRRYISSAGLALEAQGYIDAPNHPQFPSIILDVGEVYYHQTCYEFLIKKNK